MRQNRQTKMVAILALCVAVLGLTIGFAAFARTLTIKSSATVSPDSSNFRVLFSSSETEVKDGELAPVLETSEATGSAATIVNGDNPTISGINVKFKKAPSGVMYAAYIHNVGKHDAYLNKVTFNNVANKEKNIVCTAATGTNQALVDQACENMVISILTTTDRKPIGEGDGVALNITETQEFNGNIKIVPGETHVFSVAINYTENVNTVLADGDFTVEFGDLTFDFSTAP